MTVQHVVGTFDLRPLILQLSVIKRPSHIDGHYGQHHVHDLSNFSDTDSPNQLRLMESVGLKADIEAIYGGPSGMAGLTKVISSAVLKREFV
jgi:hypothetical protein